MGTAPPLLTLRDLLELACESSCSEGFRTYPRRIPWHCDDAVQLQVQAKAEEEAPVRLLIQAGLRRSPSRTLSSFLFPRNPGSLTAVSRLTRSLSRRLVFWRRHHGDEDDDDGDASDVGERDSLGLPSPVVSSCSASEWSEHAESVAQTADVHLLVLEGCVSNESEKPSPSTSSGCTGGVDDDAADGDGPHKALDDHPVVSMMEEKQQLSPMSILDFPFHDDDGDERSDAGTCSPSSFLQCQPDLERSRSADELVHKIRRLDGLAQQGVDPVDLEPRFEASDEYSGVSVSDDTTQTQSNSSVSTDNDDSAATTPTPRSSDEQQQQSTDDAEHEAHDDHHRLLAQLVDDGNYNKAPVSVGTERLLLDFFAEGLDRRRSLKAGPVLGTVKTSDHERDEPALVRAAREWVQGAGTQWGVEDVLFAGAAALADMDRERRWMCVRVEEREVGVAVEGLVLDELVAELASDMAAWC